MCVWLRCGSRGLGSSVCLAKTPLVPCEQCEGCWGGLSAQHVVLRASILLDWLQEHTAEQQEWMFLPWCNLLMHLCPPSVCMCVCPSPQRSSATPVTLKTTPARVWSMLPCMWVHA
jgi:hypothetical protein